MPKSIYEVAPELKPLVKLFDKFQYRWDVSQILQDLLIMTIAQCSFPEHFKKEHSESMDRYNRDEKDIFNELLTELMHAYKKGIDCNGWFDPLGDIYMALSSKSKASAMGQFFTPTELCKMCAMMTLSEMEKPTDHRLRILDPASGSARMLLAGKDLEPQANFYACDKDYTCFLMSVLNMAVHGCVGEVMWGDALWPEWDYVTVYSINEHPLHLQLGVPIILKKEVKSSLMFGSYESLKKAAEQKQAADEAAKEAPEEINQLTLF